MTVSVIGKEEYTSVILPEKCAGTYWLQIRNQQGKLDDAIAVEAKRSEDGSESNWYIRFNRRYRSRQDPDVREMVLVPLTITNVIDTQRQESYYIYTEPADAAWNRYKMYKLTGASGRISIGRTANNNICFNNQYVSQNHASLEFGPGHMNVIDQKSRNGTYVNRKAVQNQKLNIGDSIYILGMRIIYCGDILAINNPDERVTIQSPNLIEYHPGSLAAAGYSKNVDNVEDEVWEHVDYFYRPPRIKNDIETYELRIDPPPSNQNKDEMPMIMLIGPSMTMGMASIATGCFAVSNALAQGDVSSAMPSIVMSISMLLGTLMWPLITRTYQRRLQEEREAKRQRQYTGYLGHMASTIEEEVHRQERVLCMNDVSSEDLFSGVLRRDQSMWGRINRHPDFLSLRLGTGELPLHAKLQFPEQRFNIEDDNLEASLFELKDRHWVTQSVPICVPLADRRCCGIYGKRSALIPYAQNLILRLAATHAYDEMKLAVLYSEDDSEAFSFTRYLPHTMNAERTQRFIATNTEEVKALSVMLDQVIESRKAIPENEVEDEVHFVFLCLDKKLSTQAEYIRRVLECKKSLAISVLCFYDRLEDLPKECDAVVSLDENGLSSLTMIDDSANPPIMFRPDIPAACDIQGMTRIMANTEIDIRGTAFNLPTKLSFFEMLDIGMVDQLNLVNRWKSNDPTKSLAAPIGVDRYGDLFYLDLHERSHGPHGLVAGMTGSGKSEFLISYILSMAINYHPYEVAFILIDYKGGGMAKSFDNIPHTAGVITNLDGNGITRSLVSMKSELHRRENIFREVSAQFGISNIDIYKYQKLYREGKVEVPLPHLIVISDEFAELKAEQSDFMRELTSTARVGRSLGVHLILATQKPGGIVDDQIRSNSRFRVSLKVQDNGDSMEMLGRPDAAALVETGRFYLMVGNNESFELGQSAWAGAPYYPSVQTIKDKDDAVSVVNTLGQVISEANIDRFAHVRDPKKQLDVITNYICKVSEEEHIISWKMWLPPIPGEIYLDELIEKYKVTDERGFILNPVIGEYDLPAKQAQNVLRLPITAGGNIIVYGSPGNGKEMFLEAMCYSLMKYHTPSEVNLYILDFGAEMLRRLTLAPHVGDVILSYEAEKIGNLFKLMMGKLQTRKKKLSEFGGDIQLYNSTAEDTEPNIVVIINNFAAFAELYENHLDTVNYLSREGSKYGIYFVLTSSGINGVKFNLRQNFSQLFCLQMNSTDDYSSVVGKTEGLLPENHKGRGIFRPTPIELYEFQVGGVTREENKYAVLSSFCEELSRKYPNVRAQRVPILPEVVDEAFVAANVVTGDLSRVPVGVERSTLGISAYDFTETTIHQFLSAGTEWMDFTDAITSLVATKVGIETMVLCPGGTTSLKPTGNLKVFTGSAECYQAVYDLFDLALSRHKENKVALSAGKGSPDFKPIFVVIRSIADLREALEHYQPAGGTVKTTSDDTPIMRLDTFLDNCRNEFKIYVVISEAGNRMNAISTKNWYKTRVQGNHGIWIGNGFTSQYRITASKRPAESNEDLESNFGFHVQKGNAVLIKLLQEGEAV